MKDLTILHAKFKNHQKFNDQDLFFIYEIFRDIKSFGFEKDPKMNEILETRNRTEDFEHMMSIPKLTTKELEELRSYGNDALMCATERGNQEKVELIMKTATENLNPDELKEFLTKAGILAIRSHLGYNCFTEKTAELVLKTTTEKLSTDELKIFLTEAHEDGDNALMLAIETGSEKVVELLLNTATKNLNPDEFTKFLTKSDNYDINALWIAARARSGNEKLVALLLKTATENLSPDEFTKFLTKPSVGCNALGIALSYRHEIVIALLLKTATEKLNPDEFKEFLIKTKDDGSNSLIQAIETRHEKIVELILKTATENLNPSDLKTFIHYANPKDRTTALKIAKRQIGHDELVSLIKQTLSKAEGGQGLQSFLRQCIFGRNVT